MCPAAIVLIAFVAVVAGGAVLVAAVAPLLTRGSILPIVALVPVFTVGRIGFSAPRQFLVAVIFIIVVATRPALVLEPRPAFAQHAEIMVRELQIIFGLDAVSG
jgi:hypothetical protein